jgi:ribulose-phosphate 3-epimerase
MRAKPSPPATSFSIRTEWVDVTHSAYATQSNPLGTRTTSLAKVKPVTLPIQIAPSVLPADFSKFGEEIHALDEAGVDIIQFDVMDGQFVPNLTFGPDVIAAVRPYTTKPFEAHLMVYTPDVMAQRYIEAGCQRLIVHAEACTHLHRTLENIRTMGATAAVALNPHTPASTVENILDLVDMVLVMTVNPGFGGQSYIKTMEPKIRQVRDMIAARGLSDTVHLEVDGGISPTTIAGAAKAGANVLIAGSALYKDPQGLGHAVTELRALATAAFAD